jgi:hypothetical protein
MSLRDDRLSVAFRNAKGDASLCVVGLSEATRRLTPTGALTEVGGGLRIMLEGDHDGAGSIATTIGARTGTGTAFFETPATLEVKDRRAVLHVDCPSDALRLRIGDRVAGNPSDWVVRVRSDRARLTRGAAPARPAGARTEAKRGLRARVRRRIGRMLRRFGLRR